MNIIIKSTNVELSQALREYAEKRLSFVSQFAGETGMASVELEKTTNHHRSGDIFRAEVNVQTATGAQHRAVSEKSDLYEAIDDIRNEIKRELVASKGKERRLWKRGALAVKAMMRGGYDSVRNFRFGKKK